MAKSKAPSTPRSNGHVGANRVLTASAGSFVATKVARSGRDNAHNVGLTTGTAADQGDTGALKALLTVLTRVRAGDFTVRAPLDWTGLPGRVAAHLNDVIAANQALEAEIVHTSKTVGVEGKLYQRILPDGRIRTWSGSIESINRLIDSLVDPTNDMLVVIGAVADGDLSKRISTHVSGDMLEFKNTINTMADQLDYFVSELTRVACEVGTEGRLDNTPVFALEARGAWKNLTDSFDQMVRNLTLRTQELQSSTDQLRLLADAAPIGIFQTDRDNRFVYVNPCWSDMTSIKGEVALGKTWDEVVESQLSSSMTEIVDFDEGRSDSAQRFEIRRPGAPARIVLTTAVAIPDTAGGLVGEVGVVSDITAETEARTAMSLARDAADEASRLKSDFLANMSHEIRTPMNGVIGLTELLLETDLDPRQRDYAQAVQRSGQALLEIINDILDFSKVEAGKLEVAHDSFGLRVVIDDVVDLLAGSAQRKGLELVVACERSVPAVVTGDAGRLRQVLTNLLGNAIKFSHHGEIVLRVIAGGSDADAEIRFEISDLGDGIAPYNLESIFQPFVQVDTSTARKYEGTGLGLAISAQLVTLMGGKYGVFSLLGTGSTFWFSIPITGDAHEVTHGSPTPEVELDGVRVLVADDSPTQLCVLRDELTSFGMNVTALDSAPDALASLRQASSDGNPFAVALLDWSMPDVDGISLTDAIASDKALDTPIVLMNSFHKGRNIRSTVPGVSASLSKPVHRQELLACVRVALGIHVDDLDATIGTAPFPASRSARASGRILLAEDNLINQKVAVAMLNTAGYRVDTVPDGISAVQAAATQRYDAILMDCQLPGLSGYQATAEIRAKEGSDRHTPIIAMTAGARREDRERCLSEGMDSYLSKPVSRESLLDLVEASIAATNSSHGGERPEVHQTLPRNEVTLDLGVFDKLRLLENSADGGFLSDLVSQFVSTTDMQMRDLHSAVEDGDGRTVGRIAQSIKEGSARLGGRRLALACSQLERRTLTSAAPETRADLDKVESEYDGLRIALMQELSASGGKERVGP